jgi:hypothetical protein
MFGGALVKNRPFGTVCDRGRLQCGWGVALEHLIHVLLRRCHMRVGELLK